MWVVGYWREHGFKPEDILSLTPDELAVCQAVAELNREQKRQEIKEAVLEAVEVILNNIKK